MKTKHMAIAALSGALLCGAAFADDLPPLPQKVFLGTINGKVNVVLANDFEDRNFVFQRKGENEDDSAYETIQFREWSTWDEKDSQKRPLAIPFYRGADFVGGETLRVASTNAAGEHAGWLVLGTVTNHVRHIGNAISASGAQGYQTNTVDGVVATYRETADKYSGVSNLWFGVNLNSPVEVGKIRYVPRQSSIVGLNRIVGAVFECADDAAFSNPVRIGSPVPDDATLGGVLEMALDQPVTAQYFRINHMYKRDFYLTIAELECCPATLKSPINISVSPSDITNMYAEVSWSVPAVNQCTTAVVERAYSPAGPFTAISEWSDATTGGTCRDAAAAIGVPCYYRLRTWAEGGLARFVCSDPIRYVRSRQLERDPMDLSALRSGVALMEAFLHVPEEIRLQVNNNTTRVNAFDGDVATFAELTCYTSKPYASSKRHLSPLIGVDLGADAAFHIITSYVVPRSGSNRSRTREFAIYGANEADISDRCQISAILDGFTTDAGQYNFTTNTMDVFRYVFLLSPTLASTYGNVAETCFFGYTDQDTIDSGVLIPPPTVACATNELGVALSWEKAWNAESLRVERRRAGADGAWTLVASLAADAVSFVDETVPRSGTWEWRVTAIAEGSDPISSLPCSCFVKVTRGLVVNFR